MAHFFEPYTGVPVSSVEVMTDGQLRLVLWGGGPAPDYNDLDITFLPPLAGSVQPKDALDVGGHNRLFWLNGKAVGNKLHALNDGDDYAQTVDVQRVNPVYRGLPPPVPQNQGKSECWACALASWILATGRLGMFPEYKPGIRLATQLIDKYSDLEDDGISEWAIRDRVAVDFNMRFWQTRSATFDHLKPGHWTKILRERGYLYFVYKSGYQSSHALCVYGIGCRHANPHHEPMISAMDPWFGGMPHHRPFNQFYGGPMIIAYPV